LQPWLAWGIFCYLSAIAYHAIGSVCFLSQTVVLRTKMHCVLTPF